MQCCEKHSSVTATTSVTSSEREVVENLKAKQCISKKSPLKPCALQCTACSVQCAACSVQCTPCSVQCAMCSVQRAMCSVQRAVLNIQFAACGVHCVLCSVQRSVLQCAVCSVQCAVWRSQPAVCSVQCTGLRRSCHAWHAILCLPLMSELLFQIFISIYVCHHCHRQCN